MSGLPEYIDGMKWELAYWEWLAKYGQKRVWRSGWDRWALTTGSDEMGRRTIVVGPLVIALWRCRCADCKADKRALQDALDADA